MKSFLTLAILLVCSLPAAAQCTWTLTPASAHVTAAKTTGTVSIAASSPSCAFSVKSNNPDWLVVAFGQSGTGNGSFGYTVNASTLYTPRTGTISVGAATFTVTQDAYPCTYTFAPTFQTVQMAGGNFNIGVTTACTWSAAANTASASWISIAAGGSPTTGNGSVAYTVAPNNAVAARNGVIQINDQTFGVTQFGTGCTYLVDPLAPNFTAAGGTGQFTMQADSTCPWTVSNPAPWIGNILANGTPLGSAKSGNATISYTVSPNNSSQTRYAELAVGGQQVTVTQAGVGIQFSYFQVVNGASFVNGQIAPGEMFTIFGSGLGPTAGAGLQLTPDGGYVATSLAGTQVLFDGMPAPVTYASDGQVNAIVPFELNGAVSTKIQVVVNGTASSPVTMFLTPASPAIFPGAILNQDSSANNANNAAPIGTVLQIFATGGGQTSPSGVDGQLAGATPSIPLGTVTAQIGGVAAPVEYAGTASGLVAGVMQVNVYIPQGAPSGGAVPLTISVGGITSQPGIAVAIQ